MYREIIYFANEKITSVKSTYNSYLNKYDIYILTFLRPGIYNPERNENDSKYFARAQHFRRIAMVSWKFKMSKAVQAAAKCIFAIKLNIYVKGPYLRKAHGMNEKRI